MDARSSTAFRQRPITALLAALTLVAGPAAADGWAELRGLRSRLESAAVRLDFRQEFLPAGFSSGEVETGRLTLALPGCLRWDYDEPFPKSYLLCDETVWTWNPGEAGGRTFRVDPEAEGGLDLLRLGIERLSRRYDAELLPGAPDGTVIRLEPLEPTTEIVSATLTLADGSGDLVELWYRDVEGNTTRFTFGDRHSLAGEAVDLRPPADLVWIED